MHKQAYIYIFTLTSALLFLQIIALYTVLYPFLLLSINFGCSLTYLYHFLFFKIVTHNCKVCDRSLKNKSTVTIHHHHQVKK